MLVGLVLLGLALLPADSSAYSVYALNTSTPASISQYDADPTTGALTPKSPATVATANSRRSIAIAPDGRHLYIAGGSFVEVFDIATDGKLTAHGLPVSISGSDASDLVVSPNGENLYVASTGTSEVKTFQIAADGTLSAPTSTTTFSAPPALAINPNGQRLWISNQENNDMQRFDIGAGGALSNGMAAGAGNGAYLGIAFSPGGQEPPFTATTGGMAVTPGGNYVYAADISGSAVRQFSASPFAPLTPATYPFAAGVFPRRVAVSPDGKHLYTSDGGPSGTSVFQLNIAANGTLSQIAPPVAAGTNVRDVAVSPNQPPVASFTATPGKAGSATAFDGSGSTSSTSTIAHYDWEFGDGDTATDGGPSPSHVYASPGTYEARLTVRDAAGCAGQYIGDGNVTYCNGSAAAITETHQVVVPPGVDKACERAKQKLAKAKAKLKKLKKNGAGKNALKKAKAKVKDAKKAVDAKC